MKHKMVKINHKFDFILHNISKKVIMEASEGYL